MEEKPKEKKKPGNKKGRKPTVAEITAGKANLAKWLKEHPYPALKHGGFSRAVRERWSSLRTKEGKELRKILDSFVADAGGAENLNQGQHTMLGIFKVCYIVTKQIGEFVERQENGVFDKSGDLLPALHRVCTFTGAMQRAVESFYSLSGTGSPRFLSSENGLSPEIQSRLDGIFQKALPGPSDPPRQEVTVDQKIEAIRESLREEDGLTDSDIERMLKEVGSPDDPASERVVGNPREAEGGVDAKGVLTCSSAEIFDNSHNPVAAEKIFSENDSPGEDSRGDLVNLLNPNVGGKFSIDEDQQKN